MKRNLLLRAVVTILAAGVLIGGLACTTPPPVRVVTPQEQVRIDQQRGRRLAEEFEAKIKIKTDIEVNVYLRQIAEKLIANAPELATAPIGVQTVISPDQKWGNYGLPGNRVYLSIELIRQLQFENELAALIALELGHISRRHAFARLERAQEGPGGIPVSGIPGSGPIDFFGPAGLFAYSDAELQNAAIVAIRLMYNAGFDPRGLIALFENYSTHPEASPYGAEAVEKTLAGIRQAIVQYPPLRNPVVRSSAFIAIQKRIQKL